jgi:hypothetical protein
LPNYHLLKGGNTLFTFNGPLPLFDKIETTSQRPGPPSRLDIHQRKLEHDKMYLQSFEIEQLSRPRRNERRDQQFAELALLRDRRQTRVNRMRLRLSSALMSIAKSIRPSDAGRRDIASVR